MLFCCDVFDFFLFCFQLGSIFLVWCMLVYSRTVSSKTVIVFVVLYVSLILSVKYSACLHIARGFAAIPPPQDPAGDFRPPGLRFVPPLSKFLSTPLTDLYRLWVLFRIPGSC